MCISCCSKLFLYLLAYDEFLASIKKFTTCFHRNAIDPPTTDKEVDESLRKKSLPQIFLTHSQSESKIGSVAAPLRLAHRQRLTSISIPVADFIEQTASRSYPPARRMSMMPSVSYGVFSSPIKLQTANEMRQARRVNRHASTRSQRVAATLANPSSSSIGNLARSRSLAALHSHMRHSPNCKLRQIADDET